MGACVAEYLGCRTDDDTTIIRPVDLDSSPLCPFSAGNTCRKCKQHYEPVCCVRNPSGTLWITCPDRFCSSKKDLPLSRHQIRMLHDIARHVFEPTVSPNDVCVKREVPLPVVEGTNYKADFIMSYRSGRSPSSGPDRVVLEMQGGGETSNTGIMTDHIRNWRLLNPPNNSFLRQETSASTLETNAWRRQQEQFIVKGNIAMQTWKGLGIVFCVGSLLFDYLTNKLQSANLPDLRGHNWTLALLGIKEAPNSGRGGPIPLCIDDNKLLYTNYQTFVQALINQGQPAPEAFSGTFVDLNNHEVDIPLG